MNSTIVIAGRHGLGTAQGDVAGVAHVTYRIRFVIRERWCTLLCSATVMKLNRSAARLAIFDAATTLIADLLRTRTSFMPRKV
jgi:hypothetical protein